MRTYSSRYVKGIADGQYKGFWCEYVVTIHFVDGDVEIPVADPSEECIPVVVEIFEERAFVQG